jgi:hypothetical protein
MRALLTLQWKGNYFRRMSSALLIADMAWGKTVPHVSNTFFRTVPPTNTLLRWVNENTFVSEVQTRPCPTLGRPVHLGSYPIDCGPVLLCRPFRFRVVMITWWTPCPPKYSKRWLQVGCVQLSPSCPFGPLHTFRFVRPARLRTPLLRYGAPHLSSRGTSTLLHNPLLSMHFQFADNSGVRPGSVRVAANH